MSDSHPRPRRSAPLMEAWRRERLSCLLQILSAQKMTEKLGLLPAAPVPAELQTVLDAWGRGELPAPAERAALETFIAVLNAPLIAVRAAKKAAQRDQQLARRRDKAAQARQKSMVLKKL